MKQVAGLWGQKAAGSPSMRKRGGSSLWNS